jgi:hypothetical protein
MRRIRASGGGWRRRGSRSGSGRSTRDRVAGPARRWRHCWQDGKVRLVCFPHCSNVMAEINDVAAICARWRGRRGADGGGRGQLCAARVPRRPALGCDVYLFSAYKTYGPHQGIMVIREAFGMGCRGRGISSTMGYAVQAAHPGGAGSCAGRGLRGDGRLHRCAGGAAWGRRRCGGAEPAAVHDLMRAQEVAVIQPLLDYLGRATTCG